MENIFDYTLLPDGAAALVRAYGDSPLLSLPEALPASGGMAPLRVLGAYCLAETVRSAPRGPVLRCGRAGDGALCPLPYDPAADLHPAAFWRRSPCPTRCGRWTAAPSTTAAPCAG